MFENETSSSRQPLTVLKIRIFVCIGQLIVMTLIQVVKLLSMAVAKLPFSFGLFVLVRVSSFFKDLPGYLNSVVSPISFL